MNERVFHIAHKALLDKMGWQPPKGWNEGYLHAIASGLQTHTNQWS